VVQRWATGWITGGLSPGKDWEIFCSSPRPDRIWYPPSLLSNGYQRLFLWGLGGWGVKLTTHLHLMPRSKNEWSYTSTPPVRLHGVVLNLKKKHKVITFTFTVSQ
jgi:hypothetical protein